MTPQIAVWTREKLTALEAEIASAERLGQDRVVWEEGSRPSYLGYRPRIHDWSLVEARARANKARAQLDANPPRVYPENKEGPEP